MKRIAFLCTMYLVSMPLTAGITTYTFTSTKWASKIESTPCDGQTDGWICDKEASDYNTGRNDAEGRLYSQGVSVKTGSSGAGATSVLAFEQVRRLTFNFCQNSSKGRGVIYVQIGDNETDSIVITKPAQSGDGIYNRDSVLSYTTPQSGKIRFWVKCTENAININSLSIRAASGGSSVFTMDTYRLVTDVAQLEDSDQIIFGVYKEGVNYIMGYFDEWESVNNIHAIPGKYSSDRNTVNADDRAVYTLRIADWDGQTAYIFQDELRYEEAYLVASGGRTKNRLALWTDVVDEKTYGNYGFWDIRIENGGEAVITNLGNSLSKIIQYNASNTPTLFSCYQERSQTPVCLYRRVEAMGDVEAIVAPFVNFGTTIENQGARTIEINANKLTQDISATLKKGAVFSLSANTLDRDGDKLTVTYEVPEPGHYTDTLVLTSGDVQTEAAVLLQVLRPLSVSEAVQSEDHAVVYLNEVIVTKKFDTYIYIRDETGSMLLFDRGNGETGKRYGADLKAGDLLSGVTGRFINYFGVPEISPSEQFRVGKNEEVLPEEAPAVIDSADVCRYLILDSASVDGTSISYRNHSYAMTDKFNLQHFVENKPTRIYVIVSYDWNEVTLYVVKQEEYPDSEDLDCACAENPARLVMRNGIVLIKTDKGIFTLTGEPYNENR